MYSVPVTAFAPVQPQPTACMTLIIYQQPPFIPYLGLVSACAPIQPQTTLIPYTLPMNVYLQYAANQVTYSANTSLQVPMTMDSPVTPVVKVPLKEFLYDETWQAVLECQFDQSVQPNFETLDRRVREAYAQAQCALAQNLKVNQIFPPKELIFNALNLTPLDKVKVVTLGQDPYHGDGQAMGLAFSVPKGKTIPPSLNNIYRELERDPKIPGFTRPDHGCLEDWAKQGVLLLNTILTVEANKANSHAKFGWQTFTDSIIKAVSDNCDHVVFLLLGDSAHKKENLVDKNKHAVIKYAHPSPHPNSKFPGCNCFSDCNDHLWNFGLSHINWSLPN